MLEIIRRRGPFSIKEIWFSKRPYLVTGYDSVIFYHCEELLSLPGFEVEEFSTSVIDLTQDLDTIWRNISSSCRKGIRRAERHGVRARETKNFEEFYSMYRSFARAKGLGDWNMGKRRFIEYIRNGMLLAAELEGRMIAAHLYFADAKQMISMMAPSRRFEQKGKLRAIIGHANRLLIWEAIKYGKDAGVTTFDLGGMYTGSNQNDPKYSINQFKSEFGGKLVTVYHYHKDSGLLRIVKRTLRTKVHA